MQRGRQERDIEPVAAEPEYHPTVRDLTGYGTYVWMIGEDCFTDVTDFVEVLGMSQGSLSAGGAFEAYLAFVHEDDRVMVRRHERAAIAGGSREFRTEHRVVVEGSTEAVERWVEKSGRVFFGQDGVTPLWVVGVFCDVTERRAVEHARLRLQKLETIATMTGGIAHDFNNVLGPILSYVQLAQTQVDAGSSPRSSLREVDRAVERARQIVARLLAYTREEDAQRITFDLAELVEEACALMRPALGRSVALDYSYEPRLPDLHGDPTLLHQVVINLITNANQALGDQTGTITVALDEVSVGPSSTGVLEQLAPGAYLRLRVCDDGPGIPAEVMDRLFDPFFTTKPSGIGTGLGLASVQGAVRGHGGAITAETLAEGGARFVVFLPVDKAQLKHPAAQPGKPESVPSGGQPHVLFVDDEEVLLKLAGEAMPHYGCTVEGHQDPEAALAALNADPSRYDVLITDFSMPQMTGLDLIASARQLRPDLPTILTSGYMTAEEHERARQVGVNAIVPKPCSVGDLVTEVHRLQSV